MSDNVVLSFGIERRVVWVCRFRGVVLEFIRKRELAADAEAAEGALVSFAQWAIEQFSPDGVVLEANGRPSLRRQGFRETVAQKARTAGIPVGRVSREELCAAFGEPPLKSRAELRRVVRTLFPVLQDSYFGRGAVDAAALGLVAQVRGVLNAVEEGGRHAGHA